MHRVVVVEEEEEEEKAVGKHCVGLALRQQF
jgi:hypothetical protein